METMKPSTINEQVPSGEVPKTAAETDAIPVVQEQLKIEKEQVVTGKIKIKKTVTEEVQTVNVPVFSDEYEITRVPVEKKTLDTPPPAMREEGDKTIISVIREITIVEKRYEVIEEIHIRKHKREIPLTQEVRLKKENVSIEREEHQ
jgi:uncharacterized protein (TIGR02271 family)